MTAPQEIVDLVEKFKKHENEYKSENFSEEDTKDEFITPFFEALGWDVHNKEGKAPDKKDVRFEKHQRTDSGKIQFPDYTFFTEGIEKFYVEAKKPSKNLKTNTTLINQVRTYGYTVGLPLSIITDFEELAIYDTRFNPIKNSDPCPYKIKYYTFDEYVDKWDEISKIFSKDAIDKNEHLNILNDYEDIPKGSTEINNDFLQDIRKYRELLAKEIASSKNKDLIEDDDDLNYAVQQILDRIIFFRIAEDRHIEKEKLKNLVETKHIYSHFLTMCSNANMKYNSGLFNLGNDSDDDIYTDTITKELEISDSILKEIFKNLYSPYCPYDFKVLPLEILGKIYEEFLCEEIHLTEDHQLEIRYKEGLNKENGVYYTPQRVTRHIVKNTVGKLIKDKSLDEISKIKILDPACGSGTFLLEAYDFLLKFHLNYYLENDLTSDSLFEDKEGNKFLTINAKREILTNNIFGVDLDPRATEVTKLGLLLKVLEYQIKDKEEAQRTLTGDKILPNLDSNIKCGNSLVDLHIEEEEKIISNMEHPFSYDKEFSQVNDQDVKFDIIIGNPPYIRSENLNKKFIEYLNKHYELYDPKSDIYVCFFEKSIKLLEKNGILGFICSNQYVTVNYAKKLRKELSENTFILEYDECGNDVFSGADVHTSIIVFQKKHQINEEVIVRIKDNKFLFNQKKLNKDPWTLQPPVITSLKEKLNSKGTPINQIPEILIHVGAKTGKNDVFVIDKKTRDVLIKKDDSNKDIVKPVVTGKNIKKWRMNYEDKYIIFTWKGVDIDKYPIVKEYLKQFYNVLRPKNNNEKTGRKKGTFKWYELEDPVNFHEDFNKPKLIYPEIKDDVLVYFDNQKMYLLNKCHMITHEKDDELYLKVLGAIFSSNLMNFYINLVLSPIGTVSNHYKYIMETCPIVQFDLTEDNVCELSNLVDNIQSKNIKLQKLEKKPKPKSPQDKKDLKDQIELMEETIQELDSQINEKVYDLYDITPEEKQIIEKELDSNS